MPRLTVSLLCAIFSQIDNVTRRLVSAGQRSFLVGLFFSLGHCSVVVALCISVMLGVSTSGNQLAQVAEIGDTFGPWVSAVVLSAIAVTNLLSARDLYAQYQLRSARGHEHEIASLVGRCCPSWVASIDTPYKVFWVGLLFGLGFDTASEIALLTISALSMTSLPRLAVLLLPMLFTAGMGLVDSLNGLLMLWAYEWASDNGPTQRLYFSLFFTIASAVVALVIAALQVLGTLATHMPTIQSGCKAQSGASGVFCAFWQAIFYANAHMELVGLGIVVSFALSLVIAILLAARVVPSGTEIAKQEDERGRASLHEYLRRGEFMVRFE